MFIAHWSGISTCESFQKLEQILKSFLRLELDNLDCNFDILVKKNEKVKMELKRQEPVTKVFNPSKAELFEGNCSLGGRLI